MYERCTDRARKVMQLANQEAQRFNHEYIGTEHILLGLVKEGTGVAANVLKNLDIDLRKIRLEVEKIVQAGPDMVTMGRLPQTPRAKKVIEYSIEEARNLNHNYVGTEHLLLGLLREQEGVAAQVLMNLGLKLEDVREEVLNLLGHNMPNESESGGGGGEGSGTERTSKGKSKTPALDSFGRDLTELARQGKLDPVIGRANEIERVIQVLSRRTKNNPVLLGEAGVGKTAIVEGLAQLVVDSNVPELLRDRRIGLLDRYEAHHRVQIKDESLDAAVELSDRYISGRCLPDKAIDVIDEAGARVRLKAMTRPPDLKEIDAQIEQLNQEKESAVAEQDFEKAAHLRDQADKLKKKKEQVNREWREKSKEIDGVVDEEVIREVVSKMTGVPLKTMNTDETHRLLRMEEELHRTVISQEEAITRIARAVRKSRAGLKDP